MISAWFHFTHFWIQNQRQATDAFLLWVLKLYINLSSVSVIPGKLKLIKLPETAVPWSVATPWFFGCGFLPLKNPQIHQILIIVLSIAGEKLPTFLLWVLKLQYLESCTGTFSTLIKKILVCFERLTTSGIEPTTEVVSRFFVRRSIHWAIWACLNILPNLVLYTFIYLYHITLKAARCQGASINDVQSRGHP